ncbi:MAG: lipopolysaccharide transport periplasmic protein LptA [Pseudomonadota bacterium]
MIKPVVLALLLALTPVAAAAQVSGAAFQGFNSNSKDPVQIEADELEVIDEQAKAIFTGNVKVRQGTSTITTSRLVVEYLKGAGGTQNDIDRLIMTGGLVATSQENTVTADKGVYQVARERIQLEGKVVISQGENVATGCKLTANLKTNQAVLSACKGSGGRVSTVFRPGSAGN